MTTKLEMAEIRIDEMGFSKHEQDFIFNDWPNWDEHLDWLLTASRDEIADWIDLPDLPNKSGRPALYGKGQPMVKSALYLRQDQLDWLKSQSGETASAVVRRLIDAAINTGKPVLTDEK